MDQCQDVSRTLYTTLPQIRIVQAPKGAVVFRQGDPPCNCWLIAKGEAQCADSASFH